MKLWLSIVRCLADCDNLVKGNSRLLFDVLQIINASSVSIKWKTKLMTQLSDTRLVGVYGAASSTVFGFGSYDIV